MNLDDDLYAQTRDRLAFIDSLVQQARTLDDDEEFDADETFSRRARAGKLGRDWQVLQGRIDLGETSRQAVLDGSDDSAEAENVRAVAREGVGVFADDVRAIAEDEGEPDPVAELQRERERLLARGAALRARLSDLIDPSERMPR